MKDIPMPVGVFDAEDFDGHEQVVFACDPATGLRAIIAIHDTTLGPALGGCRIHPYAGEEDAVRDVLRLSRGMTYKAALADLALGGGKSVILADPARDKTPEMMRAMGRAVERLAGRYIVAEDVGATVDDMDAVALETRHVSGTSSGVGDPSPWTAQGVFLCLEAAVRMRLERSLQGVRVCVKGLGSVGWKLAERLHVAGATLTVADIRDDAVARARETFGAEAVEVGAALSQDVDVFAPCALGGDLSEDTISRLSAPIVCGAANNQLATPEDGPRLMEKGALYCPDYLVNAGGLIRVAQAAIRLDGATAEAKLERLPRTLGDVLDAAARGGRSPADVADEAARRRFAGPRGALIPARTA